MTSGSGLAALTAAAPSLTYSYQYCQLYVSARVALLSGLRGSLRSDRDVRAVHELAWGVLSVRLVGEDGGDETYMIRHVRQPPGPVGHGEVRVSPPRVAVLGIAAPRALGHVVVQHDIDLVCCQLRSYRVEDLGRSWESQQHAPAAFAFGSVNLVRPLTPNLVMLVLKPGFAARTSLKTVVPFASPSAWFSACDRGMSSPPFS